MSTQTNYFNGHESEEAAEQAFLESIRKGAQQYIALQTEMGRRGDKRRRCETSGDEPTAKRAPCSSQQYISSGQQPK